MVIYVFLMALGVYYLFLATRFSLQTRESIKNLVQEMVVMRRSIDSLERATQKYEVLVDRNEKVKEQTTKVQQLLADNQRDLLNCLRTLNKEIKFYNGKLQDLNEIVKSSGKVWWNSSDTEEEEEVGGGEEEEQEDGLERKRVVITEAKIRKFARSYGMDEESMAEHFREMESVANKIGMSTTEFLDLMMDPARLIDMFKLDPQNTVKKWEGSTGWKVPPGLYDTETGETEYEIAMTRDGLEIKSGAEKLNEKLKTS